MEIEESGTAVTNPSITVVPPQSLPLIRNLASCNTSIRSKSLRELTIWLPKQREITEDEMKKLWKGLFYCVWHADKAPVQSNLIDKLSLMLLNLNVSVSLHYLSVFFTTLRREWSGIDVLRLDKFYLLIRRFVNYSFQLLKKNAWDVDLCKRVMDIYEAKSLLANEKKFLGNGVNYHIASVFLDEIKSYLPVSRDVYEIFFKPWFSAMSGSKDKVLVGKIRDNVFERLLRMGKSLLDKKKNGEEEVEDTEVLNLGTVALKMGLAGKCYEFGSSSECFQGNRKVLFGLQKEFLKLEKDFEASGVDVTFPDVQIENGNEEVPELVPIVSENIGEGSKNLSKKKKKKKNKVVKEDVDSEDHGMTKENDDGNVIVANGESVSNGIISNGNDVTFTELFKSNLQMEFEKIADEEGMDKHIESSLQDSTTSTNTKVPKKRKRMRSGDASESNHAETHEQGGTAMKSGEKSSKRVKFSMKNNLVWKPQTPLPPQNLRIPPSVTPRGSALKKGVLPGPVREMPPAGGKRVMKKKKKLRKVMKTTSPAIKRLRSLQTLST